MKYVFLSLGILSGVAVVLKWTQVVDWPWRFAFAPLLIAAALFISLVVDWARGNKP